MHLKSLKNDTITNHHHHHFFKYIRELLMRGKISTYRHEIKQYADQKDFQERHLKDIAIGEVKLFLKKKILS